MISNKKGSYFITLGTSIISILIALSIIIFPDAAFDASLQGLQIWWDILFPALLPFFITSEILLGFGVVHFMGVLLEPLMKPLFKVPGVGAFVLAMGFASGYPMGAKLTTRLREQRLISKVEGERLVSFTTTSDPLFLFGAIAVGFFHDATLGVIIAAVHYSSSIIVGFIMRFHGVEEDKRQLNRESINHERNIIIKAFQAMHQARIKDGRKLGQLMGDAIMTSIQTLLMIGGFVMAFSVVLAILSKTHITTFFTKIIIILLTPLGISSDFSNSIIYGLFEVTLGAKNLSQTSSLLPFVHKIALLSSLSAWSGISVHAQVAAILQKTDIRYSPFFFSRILHAMIAFFLTFIVWKPLNLKEAISTLPAFVYDFSNQPIQLNIWPTFTYLGTHLLWLLFILLQLSMMIYLLTKKYSR